MSPNRRQWPTAKGMQTLYKKCWYIVHGAAKESSYAQSWRRFESYHVSPVLCCVAVRVALRVHGCCVSSTNPHHESKAVLCERQIARVEGLIVDFLVVFKFPEYSLTTCGHVGVSLRTLMTLWLEFVSFAHAPFEASSGLRPAD